MQFFFVKTPAPQALLHESPSLHPVRKPRKPVPTGVEPSALLHDCFLKVHYYTIVQSFRVIVGDGFWGCFLLGEGNRKVLGMSILSSYTIVTILFLLLRGKTRDSQTAHLSTRYGGLLITIKVIENIDIRLGKVYNSL